MSTPRDDMAAAVELGRQVPYCERHGGEWCSCSVREFMSLLVAAGWVQTPMTACEGSGQVRDSGSAWWGPCPSCGGTGRAPTMARPNVHDLTEVLREILGSEHHHTASAVADELLESPLFRRVGAEPGTEPTDG